MPKATVTIEKPKELTLAEKVHSKDKKVIVSMKENVPEVDFWGLWTGAEITIVQKALSRAYRQRQHLIVKDKLV